MKYELLREENLKYLRDLNETNLPISYDSQFYIDLCLNKTPNVTIIGFVGGVAVAGICIVKSNTGLYIKTIAVSQSYRGKGLGSQILCKALDVTGQPLGALVELHVWIKNSDAYKFYVKMGFQVVDMVPFYYSKLVPGTALQLKSTIKQIEETRKMHSRHSKNI